MEEAAESEDRPAWAGGRKSVKLEECESGAWGSGFCVAAGVFISKAAANFFMARLGGG